MTIRCFFAALVLVVIYATAQSLKGRGMPTELAHPQIQLKEMPKAFGDWVAEEKEKEDLDPQVFQSLGAELAINRRYHNGQALVDLHSAVFTDLFMQQGVRIPHSPETCYPGNGYIVASAEATDFTADDHSSHAARFLSLDHDDLRVYCLYWYQVDDVTFWNGDGQRRMVQSFRGRDKWPLMIKIMLQTTANSPEEAQRRLKDMAALVYAWTRTYH